ncbi:Dps family protein [Fervidibacillus halotolerans]|uniref:DNA starvation/stationary phase protection protein n=1 Tax=Fervidibacillus halotolerans TaxID=2980027 RepID=A0A9E8RXI4_9BACI|nr:Dps family protein [Fervidibacillus halotolerans]WAA11791.1 DNA starvation/stationary phase protection protein [Fervidibacillus halotolerans]
MNVELKQNLNVLTANFSVMYMKLHHFHWFVKGPHFFSLHEKFEDLYNEVTGYMDEVAERLLTLGENPISTLKECLELATVKETKRIGSDVEMVQEVIDDFQSIDQLLQKTMELAQNEGDEVTNDLLVGISASLQKHIWMLRTYCG